MKYLKYINESIEDDIKQDIKEICYDITDDGKIIVEIFLSEDEDDDDQPLVGVYNIFASNHMQLLTDETIDFYEIKDVFLRIKDYLGNRFIDLAYISYESYGWEKIELNDNTPNIRADGFSIQYKI